MKFKKDKIGFNLAENLSKNKINAIKKYRELAQLDEDEIITESSIDDWAFTKVCNQYCIPEYDMKHILTESILNETTVERTARELEAEVVQEKRKGQIEEKLDDCLDRALEVAGEEDVDYPNVLIVGAAGFAKTAIVKQWARKNGVNLYALDAGKLNPEDLGGIVGYDPDDPHYTRKLGNKDIIEELSKPRSVLFLDEYNRARSNIRSALLKLVQNHVLPSGKGDLFLPNLLFTVAAINPSSTAYEVNELDDAETSRFDTIEIIPDPLEHLDYLNSYFDERIKKAQEAGNEKFVLRRTGQKALANTILKDPRFEYTSLEDIEEGRGKYKSTNYRSFLRALEASDGTKDSLLKVWNTTCDARQKKTIEDILKNFKDVDDKANQVLKSGTKSKVLQKEVDIMDKVNDYLASLGEDPIDLN